MNLKKHVTKTSSLFPLSQITNCVAVCVYVCVYLRACECVFVCVCVHGELLRGRRCRAGREASSAAHWWHRSTLAWQSLDCRCPSTPAGRVRERERGWGWEWEVAQGQRALASCINGQSEVRCGPDRQRERQKSRAAAGIIQRRLWELQWLSSSG